MKPTASLRQLAQLRRRLRLMDFAWGVSQWLILVTVVFLLACSIDWLIDRRQETPWLLRGVLLVAQATLWGGAAAWLIIAPQFRDLSDRRLALWVESRVPGYDHRLISAIQLNAPDARTAGMSQLLIDRTTQETEDKSSHMDFIRLMDQRRFTWSGLLLGLVPILVLLAAFWVGPGTIEVLFKRQFLSDEPIPRSIHLQAVSPVIWPSGEAVALKFHATRRPMLWGWPRSGRVRVYPVGRPPEDYELLAHTEPSEREGTFEAFIPATSVDFTYRAWLGDGRTQEAGYVHFEPRPVVRRQDAWVRLPLYVGTRPDGSPFEQYQPRGEIIGLFGSSARVTMETHKPVTEATLELLGHPAPDLLTWLPTNALVQPISPNLGLVDLLPQSLAIVNAQQISTAGSAAQNELGPELARRRIPMQMLDGSRGEASFDLRPNESAYRIIVVDEHGFANADPPRRGLMLQHDEPPHVELLPEHFTSAVGQALSAETEVEGKPIPLAAGGGKVRIAYRAQDSHGLSRAQLRYRIIRREDPENPGPWFRLPLDEVQVAADVGPFDPKQGVFANSGLDDQIEFHAEPSRDPERLPGRFEGGGRFDFQTGALELRVGDQLEVCVEVLDKNPDPDRNLGRSEIRRKLVVTPEELTHWLLEKAEHENRIRELEKRQREVPGRSSGQ